MARRLASPVLLAWTSVVLVGACGPRADVQSSNLGAGSATRHTTVADAVIVPPFAAGTCEVRVGDDAALRFTVTNASSTDPDRLLAVHSDVADASRLTGDLSIPPGGTVGFGRPTVEPVGPVGEVPEVALLGLRNDARPATSHDVVFEFEGQGPVTVRTPIEACPTQQR